MEANSISLRETLGPVSFVSSGDVTAADFCCDSRNLRPGDVFVAIPGASVDGHRFVESAAAAGAAAVIVERPNPRISIPQCVVPDVRAAYSRICMAQLGHPEKYLTIAGVTGTNGKTTTSWLLRGILEAANRITGLLGTIEYSDGVHRSEAHLTTPPPQHLAQMLARMARQNASHCVMELSSHALDQRRAAGLSLSAAAITNVTRDHFDYHGTEYNYHLAKSRIAQLLKPDVPLLLGIDSPGCRHIRSHLPNSVPIRTFGFDGDADLRVETLSSSARSQQLRLNLATGTVDIETSLVGCHNALNVLTAASMAEQLGVSLSVISDAIEQVSSVPGRMERIDAGQPFTVLVDYAHTPDGIVHCIATARALTAGRVILVFGAGGNRDREKRPLMAQAAMAADAVYVTSDNPRGESPLAIIDEICAGFAASQPYQTIPDRNTAIMAAIQSANAGDVVLIAGRGHERVQMIGDRSICFDDRKVAMRHLRELLLRTQPNSRFPDAVSA